MSFSMQSFANSRRRVRFVAADRTRERLIWLASLNLSVLDFTIAFARKVAGFCALLTLGWVYLRILALGEPLRAIYPTAPDPDLRHALWVALLLVLAQGWDIPTDALADYWRRLHGHFANLGLMRADPLAPPGPLPNFGERRGLRPIVEPIVVKLGCFMDLCVAIANKVGAFAIVVYLLYLAEQVFLAGSSVRQLYPAATDPSISFLADLCVYVVVLGWWATPFEQINMFWQRLRASADDARRSS